MDLPDVEWVVLNKADPALMRSCDAIVADFRALTDEWEALLAHAVLDGHVVFQVESLTGRVEIDHFNENSFGYLVPMRAYALSEGCRRLAFRAPHLAAGVSFDGADRRRHPAR